MTITGSCECNAVTYSITDSSVYVYACHCLNCQTRSGSAFAEHAMVSDSSFTFEGGTTGYKRSENGIEFEEVFCAICHTRIFNRNSLLPDMIFLRAGTLAGSQTLGSRLIEPHSQNKTVAASMIAEKNVSGHRSYRVATRRQSLRRPNMISMRLRRL